MADLRALVVDDDPRVCRILARLLEDLGYETLSVEDGESFRELWSRTAPTLVVLDLQLSDETHDGVALLRFLAEQGTRASVLVLSGMDARLVSATVELGRSLGLDMLEPLPKPIDGSRLRDRLGRPTTGSSSRATPRARSLSGASLRSAIDGDEIRVHFQPIIELASRRLVGAEALARWTHPVLGRKSPDEFIPVAEREGLIGRLTSRVLARAVEECGEWERALRLSVNLSHSLLDDLTFPGQIRELLRLYDIPAERLMLEVTEHSPRLDMTASLDVLARLRLKGIRVALDDFGTGFSSLDQMYRLPFDTLKIDKSFVQDMAANDHASAIVQSTVELGRALGLEIVAEGIEAGSTCERLARMGCQLGQGFYFGRPMDGSAFLDWARDWERNAAPGAAVSPGFEPDPTQGRQAPLGAGARVLWYRIESLLGAGGFGVTYLARDLNLDRRVAIKEYLPQGLATRTGAESVVPQATEQREEYAWGLARFLEEARTLARFRHPNIVRVSNVFEQHGTAYMVMEYQRGCSLARAMHAGSLSDEATLLGILHPLLGGLATIHESGFVHRDIKPDNIFLREDTSPVLLDFGSARRAVGGTQRMTTLVTPGFTPIEQYDPERGGSGGGDEQGPWTDIYALGATVYRIVAARGPVDAVARANALLRGEDDAYVPLAGLGPPGFSQAFLAAIDSALSFHPRDRPQSVAEWLALLPGGGARGVGDAPRVA